MSRELIVLLAIASCGCTQKMGEQGHLRPFTSRFVPPENTIARGQLTSIRPTVSRALLERGRQRFDIYCAACHGYGGDGDGMIVKRGFLPPPSYHSDRLRSAPDSRFFEVITNGAGAMYSYADRVNESDRWAIVAYIRALQLSRRAPVASLSIQDRKALGE